MAADGSWQRRARHVGQRSSGCPLPVPVPPACRPDSADPRCRTPPHRPPADFGFDPLGLGKNEAALRWYQQAELQNGRWAMLGVAGILTQVRGFN